MNIDRLDRVSLAVLPTPLEEAPRLGKALGLSRLLVKRDDCTGLATGGNKARKLEFLMAEAVKQEADVVLTAGGAQSNHARTTAAAAAKLGLDSILFLDDHDPGVYPGNLLLDILFNAGLRFCPGAGWEGLLPAMERYAEELRASGWKPYIIPIGGSNPVGATGYVMAMRELAAQCHSMGVADPQIFLANGTGGTQAGVLLGAEAFLPGTSVYGISVSRGGVLGGEVVFGLVEETARRLGATSKLRPSDVLVRDDYVGPGYGIPAKETNEAILLAARMEGLVLDPVYTGKAMAGLIDLARRGALDPDRPTIFLHTGGQAGLFARPEVFAGEERVV